MPISFNSAELKTIVADAVNQFMKAPIEPFPPESPFTGGGVYALYYQGDFPLYKDLKYGEVREDAVPIYVGKSNPSGWRTARTTTTNSRNLYNRIREHYRNVVKAENLNTDHFSVRCMVLDGDEGGLIGPVEAALIRKFEPLWNTVIDGFGNHTPGIGRFEQAKSGWDVLHPGREWAERCKGEAPAHDDLVERINAYALKMGLK